MEKTRIIGGGGFGTIYENEDGNVVKAIVSFDSCQDAAVEMQKQKIAFDALEDLSKVEIHPESDEEAHLIDLVKFYVVISKPKESFTGKITIQKSEYACYFIMEKLHGIPLSMIKYTNQRIESRFDENYLRKMNGENFEVMAQLAFNSQLKTDVYGRSYSAAIITEKNPLRGYFIGENSDLLDDLRENQGLLLSDIDIKHIIGFMYGLLFYSAALIPIDIEFALGVNNGKFQINVLDFGMTIDLGDIEFMPKQPRTQVFGNVIQKGMTLDEKIEATEQTTIEDLSIDLYADLEDDEECIFGWNLAKKLFGP